MRPKIKKMPPSARRAVSSLRAHDGVGFRAEGQSGGFRAQG